MNRIVLCTVLFAVLFVAMAAQGQVDKDLGDPNSRVFEGKVVAIDAGASTVTVDGGIRRTFGILYDTRLMRGTDDIKLPDVSVGDYVNVEYDKEEKGEPKVFLLTVLYKASKD